MRKRTPVPSVEEIQARAEGREYVPPPPPVVVQDPAIIKERDKERARADGLREEVERLRNVQNMRPSRMQMVEEISSIFKKYSVEPLEELLKLGISGSLTNDQKIKVWSELASYRHPKLKSVEMTGAVDMNFTIVVRKFGEPIKVGGGEVPLQPMRAAISRGGEGVQASPDIPIDAEVEGVDPG